MRRRDVLRAGGVVLAAGLGGCGARSGDPLVVSSPAFADGETLPRRFTCDGAGVSPPLVVDAVPEPTAALAVVGRSTIGVLDNPTLWTLWNVPASIERIPDTLARAPELDSLDGARQGATVRGEPGYRPPCPPRTQSADYWFQVYALPDPLDVAGGSAHEPAVEAIERTAIASNRLTVRYMRPGAGQ